MQQQQAKTKTVLDSSAQDQVGLQLSVTLSNNVGVSSVLTLRSSQLTHGTWLNEPPEHIDFQGDPGQFSATSQPDSVNGVAGQVSYAITVNNVQMGEATLNFSIPGLKAEANVTDVSISPIYTYVLTGQSPWTPGVSLNWIITNKG